jgi:DNA invertase Pin-like site-specific DNA recombinase
MEYGYVRVSTIQQNVDRQLAELYALGLSDQSIFIDKQSGKDFERDQYQILRDKLHKNDLLIIKSIDRLGRNYQMIMDEWHHITKVIECDIFVVDMPLLDTRSEAKNLVGKFISDIVLQILSFVAETERDNIKQRQAEGIRIAKAKGKHLGRPKFTPPPNYAEVMVKYHSHEFSPAVAMSILGMSKSTFYKHLNIF